MIETIVLNHLGGALTEPVHMETKNLATYVLIEKTGGSVQNRIKSATIAIQSYADSMYNAAVLNEKVKAAMEDIRTLPTVSACRLNSDYNFTDTTKKKYRYQAVFDIVYYDEE